MHFQKFYFFVFALVFNLSLASCKIEVSKSKPLTKVTVINRAQDRISIKISGGDSIYIYSGENLSLALNPTDLYYKHGGSIIWNSGSTIGSSLFITPEYSLSETEAFAAIAINYCTHLRAYLDPLKKHYFEDNGIPMMLGFSRITAKITADMELILEYEEPDLFKEAIVGAFNFQFIFSDFGRQYFSQFEEIKKGFFLNGQTTHLERKREENITNLFKNIRPSIAKEGYECHISFSKDVLYLKHLTKLEIFNEPNLANFTVNFNETFAPKKSVHASYRKRDGTNIYYRLNEESEKLFLSTKSEEIKESLYPNDKLFLIGEQFGGYLNAAVTTELGKGSIHEKHSNFSTSSYYDDAKEIILEYFPDSTYSAFKIKFDRKVVNLKLETENSVGFNQSITYSWMAGLNDDLSGLRETLIYVSLKCEVGGGKAYEHENKFTFPSSTSDKRVFNFDDLSKEQLGTLMGKNCTVTLKSELIITEPIVKHVEIRNLEVASLNVESRNDEYISVKWEYSEPSLDLPVKLSILDGKKCIHQCNIAGGKIYSEAYKNLQIKKGVNYKYLIEVSSISDSTDKEVSKFTTHTIPVDKNVQKNGTRELNKLWLIAIIGGVAILLIGIALYIRRRRLAKLKNQKTGKIVFNNNPLYVSKYQNKFTDQPV